MYRVMIVDDEPLILAGVISMVEWEAFACQIVGKATNGTQALEQAVKLQPDIIITDINMPAMNGIEFIRAAKERDIHAAFILLTNLEEFQLVKEAISLGVTEYLLKLELTEEVLGESLKRAIESCDNIRKLRDGYQGSTVGQINMEEHIRQYFQNLISYGNEQIDKTVEEKVKERFLKPVLMMINFNYEYEGFSLEFTRGNQKKLMSYAQSILEEMVLRYFEVHSLLQREQNSFILVVSTEGILQWKEQVRQMSKKMISVLKDYFEVAVVVAISEQGNSMDEIQMISYQAMSAMRYYYYDCSSPIVFYTSQCEMDDSHNSEFNISFLKKDILTALRQNDGLNFEKIMNQMVALFKEYKPSKAQAVNACSNLYYLISSHYEENDTIEFPYAVNIIGELNRFGNLEHIIEWMVGFEQCILHILVKKEGEKPDKMMKLVQAYVMKHYCEKITLADLAEELNLSQGYLSSVFKKIAGSNFTDYVNGIKIEMAKKMIEEHQYLMYEISDQLGFENPYYFSKVFKKTTGYTPKEWERGK